MSALLNQISDALNLDEKTKKTAENFIDFFNSNSSQADPTFLVVSAVFVACQSEEIEAVDGTKQFGIGVSLSQIIRQLEDSIDLEKLLHFLLNSFISKIKCSIPSEILDPMQKFIKKATISFRIFKKFEFILAQLNIQKTDESDPQENSNYRNNFRNFVWLLFLIIKHQIQEGSQKKLDYLIKEQNETFLLIAHILHSFTFLPNNFYSQYLEEHVQRANGTHKKLRTQEDRLDQSRLICSEIGEMMLGQIQVQDYFKECEQYLYHSNLTLGNVKELLNKRKNSISIQEVVNYQSNDLFEQNHYKHLFEEVQMVPNYKKYHQFYEKVVQALIATNSYNGQVLSFYLDEECFLRQKVVFTPNKYTPEIFVNSQFQAPMSPKNQRKLSASDFSSRKKEVQTPLSSIKSSFHENREEFANNYNTIFQQTPLKNQNPRLDNHQITNRIAQTPLSKEIVRFQWLKMFTKDNETPYLDQLLLQIDMNYRQLLKINITQKISTLISTENLTSVEQFYWKVIDIMISNENKENGQVCQLLINQDFIQSLLAVTIYTHQIINKKEINILNLIQVCSIQPIQLWRIISNFASFDKNIPESVKQDLFELEKNLLLNIIWIVNFDHILQLLKCSNQRIRYFEEVLLRRLKHHLALRVFDICNQLNVQEETSENLWKFLQTILQETEEVFYVNMHLDTLIFCSLYIILKYEKKGPSFKQFLDSCKMSYSNNEQLSNVFRIGPNDRTSIIEYYNDIFLPNTKEILKGLHIDNRFKKENLSESIPNSFLMHSPMPQTNMPGTPFSKTQLQSNEVNLAIQQPSLIFQSSQSTQGKMAAKILKQQEKLEKTVNMAIKK